MTDQHLPHRDPEDQRRRAWDEFKKTRDTQLKGKKDVLLEEKLRRINAMLNEME